MEKIRIILMGFILSTSAFSQTRVWIDYDLSFGKFANEVDDGIALIHSLLSRDRLDIIGLSSGFGNTDNMNHQKKWTYKILNKMNIKDISFYEGAHTKEDLGHSTAATRAIISALEDGPMTIMAMGRMTNIASVILLRPDLLININEIIINAGRMLEYPTRYGRRGIIFPDTNIDGHVEAIKVLEKSNVNLTMIPTESMTNQLIKNNNLRRMWWYKGITRWMARISFPWKLVWRVFPGGNGFIPWDLYIASYLTHPEDFECLRDIPWEVRYMKNDAHHLFRRRYRKEYKDFLVASYDLNSPRTGTYCKSIKEGHIEKLIEYWIDNNIY